MLMGRLTKDPETRYTQSNMAVCRYSLAVDRYKDGVDYINCVAFGKSGEFASKYFKKGMKVAIRGHIVTGSYDGKNGKVYTTDVAVDEQEFCESKQQKAEPDIDGFMKIPASSDEEELPFE